MADDKVAYIWEEFKDNYATESEATAKWEAAVVYHGEKKTFALTVVPGVLPLEEVQCEISAASLSDLVTQLWQQLKDSLPADVAPEDYTLTVLPEDDIGGLADLELSFSGAPRRAGPYCHSASSSC